MSGHHLDCAAQTELQPSEKLVFMALCDSADKLTGIALPGMDMMIAWSGCRKSRVYQILKQLEEAGYIRQVKKAHRGRRSEFQVWDRVSCCGLHEPLGEPVDNSLIKGSSPVESESETEKGSTNGSTNGSTPEWTPSNLLISSTSRETTYVTTSSADEAVDNFPSQDSEQEPPAADAAAPAGGGVSSLDGTRFEALSRSESFVRPMTIASGLSPVCTAHQGVLAPPPCKACQRSREAWEAESLRKAREREVERRACERAELEAQRERRAAARADPAVRAHEESIKAGIKAKFGRKVS